MLTQIPVRKNVATTGEITLRGRVLPIGGLKEKLLAALGGGVKTVIIPHENEKDLAEIPDNMKSSLDLVTVGTVDEMLHRALVRVPVGDQVGRAGRGCPKSRKRAPKTTTE